MKKEQILGRISKLEEKITELEELVQSKSFDVKTWEDLKKVNGYCIERDSDIDKITDAYNDPINRNIFKTERHAKRALAMAQISQLIPYYGGEITDDEWCDDNINKYVLKRYENKIEKWIFTYTYYFLAFHTEEQRDEFLVNNEKLVKQYLMIE